MRPYSLPLVAALMLGCAVDTTEPRQAPFQAHSSVAAAPTLLSNVARFRNEFVPLIQDRQTDLLAIGGLPDNVKDVIECGGTEELHLAMGDYKQVGVWPEDVIKLLIKGTDYNIDVYQLSSFAGVCASDPIAHGTGRVIFHENDAYRTSGRTDTYGISISGRVTLTGGGTANLAAHALFQLYPDAGGFPREVVSSVTLSGG